MTSSVMEVRLRLSLRREQQALRWRPDRSDALMLKVKITKERLESEFRESEHEVHDTVTAG